MGSKILLCLLDLLAFRDWSGLSVSSTYKKLNNKCWKKIVYIHNYLKVAIVVIVGCVIQKRLKIPDDKSDPHSGSESCGSDDMSHQSSPNVSSSTILSAFTSHGKSFIN